MPDYRDIYGEIINKVYINVVTLSASVMDPQTGTAADKVLYFCDNSEPVTFMGHDYIPVAFEVSEPDKNSLEEGSGTFTIAGVTSEYTEMIQNAVGQMDVSIGVVRLDQLQDYILPPTEYKVESIVMNSPTASVSLTLKTGGALGYFASVKTYSTADFPGLEG